MIRAAFCLTIAMGLAVSAAAQDDSPAASSRFDFQEITLDNGMKVISLEDFSCPVVAVHLWYHVGSKDEDPERQGFAHMFEHMMFRGTDRLGSTDHFDFVRQTGGNCNAYTTFDQTVYTQTLPANQLNMAMWLEAERMSMLKIDQDAFDTERRVVEEEYRKGVNEPYGNLMKKVLPEVFPGHPYRWPTIGSIPHLRSAGVQELREFWQQYYVPNNATLVVVGAATHAQVQKLAKRNFGWIPRGADPPRIAAPERTPFEAREVTLEEKNAPAPLVALVFRGVPLNNDDATRLNLMTTILGGGESSRLYRRLVADDQLAVMAMAGSLNLEQNGLIGAAAVLSPLGGNSDRALAAMADEIQKMQSDGVTADELTKAQNQLLRGLVTESLTVSSKASALGSAAVLEGDASRINTRIERIRAVTPDEIQAAANRYLDMNHAITGHVKSNLLGALGSLFSKGDDIEDTPVTGERETDAPAPGRPGVTRPDGWSAVAPIADLLKFDGTPNYDEMTLENGLKVMVVENHEVPFVSAALGLTNGAWTESHPGTASMALSMLTKGSADHTEATLAEELELYAIGLSGSATMDSCSVTFNCLPEQVERAARLLAEVVRAPTMPVDEFKKLKRQARTGLVVSSRSPDYLADRQLRRQLFGEHPYSRSAGGELNDLDGLDRLAVQQWWEDNARPDVATLIFAGDIDIATAGPLARKLFADWSSSSESPEPTLPPVPERQKTHIYLVDHPGAQSQIRVGQIGITRDDPGYFTSRVVSGYFGGAFSSRLNETIRVEKGLTYGARGGFYASKRAGRFLVSTFSKIATTAEAVEAIIAEIKRLQNEGPSDDELKNTVSYIVGSYPGDQETPQEVAKNLWFIESNGLPTTYDHDLLAAVSKTDAAACLELAQTKIDPDRLTIVVVGPAKKLSADLEKIAPVTVVEKDK